MHLSPKEAKEELDSYDAILPRRIEDVVYEWQAVGTPVPYDLRKRVARKQRLREIIRSAENP